MVRQAALHVWKVVVTNTARTLREILPVLISLILGCLASKSYDKRKVAARTLGDLVRKLGERVLPEVRKSARFGQSVFLVVPYLPVPLFPSLPGDPNAGARSELPRDPETAGGVHRAL